MIHFELFFVNLYSKIQRLVHDMASIYFKLLRESFDCTVVR